MPSKSKKSKKACNKEVKANNNERREPKKEFNSSSDEQYSLVSNQLSLVDDLRYDVEHHIRRDEVDKFVNHLVRVSVLGDPKGKPSTVGVITAVKTHPHTGTQWVWMDNVTSNGKFHDKFEVELNSILSIEEDAGVEAAKARERSSSQLRRSSTTSGYESHNSRRASRSTAATPTKMEESTRQRSRSSDHIRKRIQSGPSTGPEIISSYAAALKGAAEMKNEEKNNQMVIRDSSFPPLIQQKNEEKHLQTIDRTMERSKTPSKESSMMTYSGERAQDEPKKKLYPSLPDDEMTQGPNFRLNEPIIYSKPPPPGLVPKWEISPSQVDQSLNSNGNNQMERSETYSKKQQLCSLFTKFAQKRFKKEHEDSKNEKRAPDFHYAIKRACDLAEIQVSESEIRNIKITPETNLARDEVIEGIFQVIFVLPSTKIKAHLQPDIFSDFNQHRPTMMITDEKTGQLIYPIQYLDDGYVDELYMKATQRKYELEADFDEWMNKYEVTEFLSNNNLRMKVPDCYVSIPSGQHKQHIRSDWESAFQSSGIQFQPWWESHIKRFSKVEEKLVGKPKEESLNKNSSSDPPASSSSVDSASSSSSNSETESESSDQYDDEGPNYGFSRENPLSVAEMARRRDENFITSYQAFQYIQAQPAEEKPELETFYKAWSDAELRMDFKRFVAKKREEQKAKKLTQNESSGEFSLAAQLRRMVINPGTNPDSYSSLTTSAGSEVDYVDSGLTDLSQFTPEQWKRFNMRMCIRLPPKVSDEITQSIMVEGNMREAIGIEVIQAINANDFLPGGKFASLPIPNYIYIPPEITTELNFGHERLHNHYFILWRRLFCARMEARAIVEKDVEKYLDPIKAETKCPWVSFLLDNQVTKSFPFDEIDIIQMHEATKNFGGQRVHTLRNRQVYDRFLRPLERMFSLNMPLRDRLFYAMEDVDATEDLVAIMLQWAGIPTMPMNLSARFTVEELSRTRHLRVEDFTLRHELDAPIQLIHQVHLKQSHHRRYKHQTDRHASMRLLQLLGLPKIEGGIYKDDFEEYFSALNETIHDLNEEIDVLKKQVAENYNLASRTSTEASKTECLENNKKLKERQAQVEAAYNKQWKKYEQLLFKRARSRFANEHGDDMTDLEVAARSKSTLSSYLISWRETRQELSKERVGITVCLTTASQKKKATPTTADIEYRKTLLERQVEIDCQIGHLNRKIEKAEKISDDMSSDNLPNNDEWPEDEEKPWMKYYPTVDHRTREWNKFHSGTQTMPPLSKPTTKSSQTWSTNQWYSRSPKANQVYLQDPADKQKLVFSNKNARATLDSSKNYHVRPERPSKWQPEGNEKRRSADTSRNHPKELATARKARNVWKPLPFRELPLSVTIWNGINDRTVPKWATLPLSVLDIVNNYQNFTTYADVTETDDQFLLKITSANGLNFETRLEIKAGLDQATMMPDIVIVYETSTDRASNYKTVGTAPFPASHLNSVILALENLMAMPLPPFQEDKYLTDMVLYKTDFTEFTGAKITFQMVLHVVSVTGTNGNERMIRLKQMDIKRDNIVQFPWTHLPRVLQLWKGFHNDAKTQVNLAKRESSEKQGYGF